MLTGCWLEIARAARSWRKNSLQVKFVETHPRIFLKNRFGVNSKRFQTYQNPFRNIFSCQKTLEKVRGDFDFRSPIWMQIKTYKRAVSVIAITAVINILCVGREEGVCLSDQPSLHSYLKLLYLDWSAWVYKLTGTFPSRGIQPPWPYSLWRQLSWKGNSFCKRPFHWMRHPVKHGQHEKINFTKFTLNNEQVYPKARWFQIFIKFSFL